MLVLIFFPAFVPSEKWFPSTVLGKLFLCPLKM